MQLFCKVFFAFTFICQTFANKFSRLLFNSLDLFTTKLKKNFQMIFFDFYYLLHISLNLKHSQVYFPHLRTYQEFTKKKIFSSSFLFTFHLLFWAIYLWKIFMRLNCHLGINMTEQRRINYHKLSFWHFWSPSTHCGIREYSK